MKTAAVNIAKSNPAILIVGGIVLIGGVWAGVAIINHKRKERDRKAIAFFSELQRDIAPGTVGLEQSDAFDMYYWQKVGKKIGKPLYFLNHKAALAYAKDIQDSWGGWLSDDEEKVKGVFRALKDQVQVSQIAFEYYNYNIKEKINLIDDLQARMSKEEVGEIMAIVKKLPAYRTASAPTKK